MIRIAKKRNQKLRSLRDYHKRKKLSKTDLERFLIDAPEEKKMRNGRRTTDRAKRLKSTHY